MYGVQFNPEEKAAFEEVWTEWGWRSMPTYDRSVEACHRLHQAGYELVCVTAMPCKFIAHRLENFRAHGFPIDRVISGAYDPVNFNYNPKKAIIEELHPVAFVDDLRRNFRDLENVSTKLIFIDNECHDDPCRDQKIFYHARYSSLYEFVDDFLRTDDEHGREIRWAERA